MSETLNINRPRGLLNPQGLIIPDSLRSLAYRGDLNGGSNLVYIGYARPGSGEGDLVWQLFKISYSGSTPISITWPIGANGAASDDFEFSWTARAGYTFI